MVTAVGRYVAGSLTPAQRELAADALADEWTDAAEDGIDGCAVGVVGEIGVSAAGSRPVSGTGLLPRRSGRP
ncbi:hypothetical protein [Streptomyces sp. YKOK-I1]